MVKNVIIYDFHTHSVYYRYLEYVVNSKCMNCIQLGFEYI